MQHITGTARLQMRISNLEDDIVAQNQLRLIVFLAMAKDFEKFGFTVKI
jgi:hypothetical protein